MLYISKTENKLRRPRADVNVIYLTAPVINLDNDTGAKKFLIMSTVFYTYVRIGMDINYKRPRILLEYNN